MKWESVLDCLGDIPEDDRARLQSALSLSADKRFAEGSGAIVIRLGLDADCACALMLFSASEYRYVDFGARLSEKTIKAAARSGGAAARLLNELLLVSTVHQRRKTRSEAESARKMMFALVSDARVLFIKLAERLQTLRMCASLPEETRKKIAGECVELYAPLADSFGLSWLQNELEDLSLKYLNRPAFNQIKELVSLNKTERLAFLEGFEADVRAKACAAGLGVTVVSRAKHFYSIYQKIKKLGKSPEKLYDLFGVRVLCHSVDDCYSTLAILHKNFRPLANRFKDYIANPKPNGYQSLHTTLASGDTYIEVQIRTHEMHDIAEHGFASHWLYKKGMTNEVVSEKFLPVVNKLKDRVINRRGGYLDEIKKDLLENSVVVFTPLGMVVELPAGATALDFAYSIHEAVGEHCSMARAGGKIIPLDRPLENTEIIEIVTSQAVHPNKNWLERVVSAKALNRIRHYLALQGQWHTRHSGKEAGGAETSRAQPERSKDGAENTPAVKGAAAAFMIPVRVTGEKNFLVRFARCCNPVPGDEITGFVSRGRGIIVHRSDCANLGFINEFNERKINAEWDYSANEKTSV
ncbi:MAG: HD domain-containing protein [Spirochaetaceae bacterium]|jgi:GTP pyrophosphokinase|nr:HD domain-containing protein [Spirochaetaceae bacterium]